MSWKRPNVETRMFPLVDIILNGNRRGDYWLDIGSGDGVFAKLLSEIVRESTVIQTDVKKFGRVTELDFFATLERLPVRKRTLSGIICAQVLHYFPPNKLPGIIDQLTAKLKLGGSLLIVEYKTNHSHSWIPFPISLEQIKSIKQEHTFTMWSITKSKTIQDGNRPKFSVLIKKH